MEITPRELRDTEIHSEMRGYSRDEVNELLERAAASIDAANERVTQLQDRLTSAQSEATRTRETEDILHRTLLLAQRAADEAVAEATAKSRQMLDDAEMSSRRLVADAEAEARRKGETERRRLEQEIVELAGRRDTLLADVEALTRFESEYRERMVRSLETDLSALKTRPTTAPAAKPEPSDVEIPASVSTVSSPPAPSSRPGPPGPSAPPAPSASVQSAPPAPPGPSPSPSGPASGPSAAPDAPPAGDPAPPVPVPSDFAAPAPRNGGGGAPADAEPARPAADAVPESSAPAAESSARAGQSAPVSTETSEVDVRTLFEQSTEGGRNRNRGGETPSRDFVSDELGRDEQRRDLGASAPKGTARAAGLQPIDLSGNDAIDADILDDDAFFATLRDAVHDEKPLGPRDEDDEEDGENRFFDQDAERGSFRDVFRRRR